MLPEHGVCVYCSGAAVIGAAVAVNEVRVCDVDCRFVGGEAEAIRAAEAVCYDAYIAGGRIEAVDELWELGFRAETLLVAVNGVCEPD